VSVAATPLPRRTPRAESHATRAADPRAVGRLVLRALHDELVCYPKPGLVSRVDTGSHADMDAATFVRSLFALRHYFPAIAAAGAASASFTQLRALGLDAERRMLNATGGVNTHRGAIFNLGLLAAAAGWQRAHPDHGRRATLGDTVRCHWGEAIARPAIVAEAAPPSHGLRVAQRYGLGGARAEAAAGFPHVFGIGLPAFEHSLARHGDHQRAAVQCFFSLVAQLPDTNLLHRGGAEGLCFAQTAAREFVAAGGVAHPAWRARAESVHRAFVARRLSPGGSADLLAATLFVHAWQQIRA